MKTNDITGESSLRAYLRAAAGEFSNTRSLAAAALLCAMCIIIEKFDIPIIYGVLNISFTYVAVSLCSLLTGPLVAIPCGIITDLVGIVGTGYTCFFGYTLSAVAGAVIYALFLYRKPLTFERILLSRLTVDVLVNVFLGSVWRVMMAKGPYMFYVTVAGIKNLLMLPFEVLIMVLFLNAVLPALSRMGFGVSGKKIEVSVAKIAVWLIILVIFAAAAVLYGLHASEVNAAIKEFFL
ncbi:MAG: folate family ECF transporter S component [Eubacteriales bacterium]